MSRRVKVILTVCVGVFMAALDLFIVNIAFPDIQESFPDSSLSELSWILNAYAIVFAALLVPAGRWADRAGRRTAFMVGLAIFTAASAACALAPSVLVLVIARAVQAAGAALLFPASLGLLLPEWPLEKRGVPVGIWSAVGGVAAAAGPVVGGLLVEIDWRWVFIVNVPIGIAALVVASGVLENRRDEEASGRPDVLAAALFTVAIASLVLAIVQGESWGWTGGRVVALFAAAAVLTAIVVVRCVRHPVPLVEPAIVRTRSIALANLGSILFFISFATLLLAAVLFQTEVWDVSVLTAGLQFAPGPMTSAIFAVPGAVLGERIGQRYVGAAGAVLLALSALWFHQNLELRPDYTSAMLPAIFIGGAGVGLALPMLAGAATDPLPPSRFATGTGILGMSRQVGSALGVALFVAVLGQPTPATILEDFQNAWLLMMGAAIAAGLVLLSIGPVRAHASVAEAAADGAASGAPRQPRENPAS